jgi:CHASE2 domain-containing sensor protein
MAEASGRLPLSPLDYALFLQAVQRFEPAVVAIEPVLDWPRLQPGNEQLLVDQALSIPKLLLAAQLGNSDDARDAADLPGLSDVSGDRSALTQFPEVTAAPNPKLLPLAVCGVTNLPAAGITVREVPLLFRCRGKVLPSFVLQALAMWLQLAPSEISATPGGFIRLGDRLRIPVDRAGRALLDAGAFRRLNRIDFDDLLLLTAGQAAPAPAVAAAAARIKGGIVVLGRTDHAARVFTTPASERSSAAEVLAWAVASLRERAYIRRASAFWDAGIIVVALLLGLTLLRLGRRTAVGWAATALTTYMLAALAIFESNGLWLPCALPVGLTLCIVPMLWFLPQHRTRSHALAHARL